MAYEINLKLAFKEWFFYNLVILIKLCKNQYLNLDRALLFQETKLFVWKIENFDELQLPQSLIFFAEILHMFPNWQCLQNGVRDFFVVVVCLFRFWVINKNVKNESVESRSFSIFANNSRSKQNNKNPEETFVDNW